MKKKLLLSLILMVMGIVNASAGEPVKGIVCTYGNHEVFVPLTMSPSVKYVTKDDVKHAVVYAGKVQKLSIPLVDGGTLKVSYDSRQPSEFTNVTLGANDGNSYYGTFSSSYPAFVEFKANVLTVKVNGTKLKLDTSTFFGQDVTEEIEEGYNMKGTWVPANTGVLLKSYTDKVRIWICGDKELDPITNENFLHPASEEMTAGGYKYYMLAYGDEAWTPQTLGFYYGAENGAPFVAREGSAYLAVPVDVDAKGFCFADEATAIQSVKADENTTIYNLQGQRVSASQKGIVIVNGKKIINK